MENVGSNDSGVENSNDSIDTDMIRIENCSTTCTTPSTTTTSTINWPFRFQQLESITLSFPQ